MKGLDRKPEPTPFQDMARTSQMDRGAPTPEQRARWVDAARSAAEDCEGQAEQVSPRTAREMRADAAELRALADYLEGGGR